MAVQCVVAAGAGRATSQRLIRTVVLPDGDERAQARVAAIDAVHCDDQFVLILVETVNNGNDQARLSYRPAHAHNIRAEVLEVRCQNTRISRTLVK